MTNAMNATGSAPQPPTWSPRLVLAHWLCARAALLGVGVILWLQPDALLTSPLHPATLACAHLTVLGLLAMSIAGAFHAVGPLALRLPLRADWRDWTLLVALALAASGVASHMLLGTYSGVAWSGGMLLIAVLLRMPSWLRALRASKLPGALVLGVLLAWSALPLTVVLGITISMNYSRHFLPADRWQALVGHAHLGAGGFALLMVIALGQRLLPMFLPATPPNGRAPWLAVTLTAIGALGLGVTMPFWPAAGAPFGMVLAGGAAAFLGSCLGMLRHGKPAPPDLPRPDPARVLMVAAMLSLVAAIVLGVLLALGIVWRPPVQLAYGVLALLGALGSMVLGIGLRLMPLIGWHAAWRELGRGPTTLPRPPRRTGSLPLQWLTAIAWPLALTMLLLAIGAGAAWAARAGALLLLLATLADSGNLWLGWRQRARAGN